MQNQILSIISCWNIIGKQKVFTGGCQNIYLRKRQKSLSSILRRGKRYITGFLKLPINVGKDPEKHKLRTVVRSLC